MGFKAGCKEPLFKTSAEETTNQAKLDHILPGSYQPKFLTLALEPIATFILYVSINQCLLKFSSITWIPRSLLVGFGASVGSAVTRYCCYNKSDTQQIFADTLPLTFILSASPESITYCLRLAGPNLAWQTGLIAIAGLILSLIAELASCACIKYERPSYSSFINISAYTFCYLIFGLTGQGLLMACSNDANFGLKLLCGILSAIGGGLAFAFVKRFDKQTNLNPLTNQTAEDRSLRH